MIQQIEREGRKLVTRGQTVVSQDLVIAVIVCGLSVKIYMKRHELLDDQFQNFDADGAKIQITPVHQLRDSFHSQWYVVFDGKLPAGVVGYDLFPFFCADVSKLVMEGRGLSSVQKKPQGCKLRHRLHVVSAHIQEIRRELKSAIADVALEKLPVEHPAHADQPQIRTEVQQSPTELQANFEAYGFQDGIEYE